ELVSAIGIPERFQLSIAGEAEPLACKLTWQSEKQAGVSFETLKGAEAATHAEEPPAERSENHALRSQMLALRAAFDHVPLGIVLIDAKLNARFINRAFRKMWTLPDEVADRHPSFAALMYHGRDIGAYEMPADRIEAYVAERIELISRDESLQLDVRHTNGDVL